MTTTLQADLELASNRKVTNKTRAASTREQLADLLNSAAESQREAVRGITGQHVAAGDLAADYLAAAMAGITADHATASAAHIDQLIDASPDGRTRNSRRAEIREQIVAATLADYLPSLADLPWRHVRAVIGSRVVAYSQERGAAELLRPEWLAEIRPIVADCAREHHSREHLADQLAAVTGKETPRTRKDRRTKEAMAHAALIESLRERLPAMDELTRSAILAAHPELDPTAVDAAAVDSAFTALVAACGAVGSPTYVALLAKLLVATPDDTLTAAMAMAAPATVGEGETETAPAN